MKAFWWFKEGSIAGMARPGFNSVPWFDLPFDEAAILGWVGQHSTGRHSLESFREHLRTYVPRIFKFYGLSDEAGRAAIASLGEASGLGEALGRLVRRTGTISSFDVAGEELHVEFCPRNLQREIDVLKGHGIGRVVTLTEKHHSRDTLAEHFDTHHIGIEDLGAPVLEQVTLLADLIRQSRANDQKLAVHCLAGIGRTSTMLMGAHILLGESPTELEALLKMQNPKFILTGVQAELLRALKPM